MAALRVSPSTIVAVCYLLVPTLGLGCGADDDAAPTPPVASRPSPESAENPPEKVAPPQPAAKSEADPTDAVFQRLFATVDIDGLNALAPQQQTVYLVLRLRYDVRQGGLEYYLFNVGGDHARQTVTALQELDMPDAAAILDEACQMFPEGTPAVAIGERQNQLDGFDDTQRDRLKELEVTALESLETAHTKIEYYLETNGVAPAGETENAAEAPQDAEVPALNE